MQAEEEEVEEYQLTTVKIADLKLDPTNPNKPTKEQIEGIRKSIREFGFVKPLVINEKMEIADGEHRALVMKALGRTEIQAYIVPRINDDIKRRLARQTLNKLQGEHDIKLDADEMALIFEAGQLNNLAELIAQERESLENILTKHKGIEFQHEDNFDVDKALEDLVPTTQLGDIWQLGQHRIICADCTDKQTMEILMEGKKADMVITDPPYFIMGSSTGFTNDHADDAMVKPFFKKVLEIIKANLSFNNHAYIFCNWRSYPDYYTENQAVGLTPRNLIVWSKTNMRLGGFYSSSHELIFLLSKDAKNIRLTGTAKDVGRDIRRVNGDTNVWVMTIDTMTEREHFAEKPVKVLVRAINNSTEEGETVLDPFLGSGSTLLACEQTNRVCLGCDISPKYIEVTIRRWELLTGRKAVKL